MTEEIFRVMLEELERLKETSLTIIELIDSLVDTIEDMEED